MTAARDALGQPSNPLPAVANCIPANASLSGSLLLPDPLHAVDLVLSSDLNGWAKNVSGTCTAAANGAYNITVRTLLTPILGPTMTGKVVSGMRGGSMMCKSYINQVKGRFPAPGSPIRDATGSEDASLVSAALGGLRAVAATVVAAAIAGVVLGVFSALALAVWAFCVVQAVLADDVPSLDAPTLSVQEHQYQMPLKAQLGQVEPTSDYHMMSGAPATLQPGPL